MDDRTSKFAQMRFFQNLGRIPRTQPRRLVVAISGQVGVGKSTLAKGLGDKLGAQVIRTKEVLIREYGSAPEVRRRRELQRLGEALDRETGGRWVASAVARGQRSLKARQIVVVDAVRVPEQLDALRAVGSLDLIHVHLHAPRPALEARYLEKARSGEEFASYGELLQNRTERDVRGMRALTRLSFSTRLLPPAIVRDAVVFAVRMTTFRETAMSTLRAFGLGAVPAAALMSPSAWFLATWKSFNAPLYILLAVTICLFALGATLIGRALTDQSPVQRDPI